MKNEQDKKGQNQHLFQEDLEEKTALSEKENNKSKKQKETIPDLTDTNLLEVHFHEFVDELENNKYCSYGKNCQQCSNCQKAGKGDR